MTATIPPVVFLPVLSDGDGKLFIPETELASASIEAAIAAMDTYDHFPAHFVLGFGLAAKNSFDASMWARDIIKKSGNWSDVQFDFCERTWARVEKEHHDDMLRRQSEARAA